MSMKLRSLLHRFPPKTTFIYQSFRLFSCSRCKSRSVVTPPPPPPPKKIPFQVSVHGVTWHDPYHWMSETSDPDLSAYVGQQNSYAEAFMADTNSLRRKLLSEMTARIPAKISSPPQRWGRWFYYQEIPEGKEYPVLYRRQDSGESNWVQTVVRYAKKGFGTEEILLDWNQIAEQHGYVHVGTCKVSPDHNFLAYTIDILGGEDFILQAKDLRTGLVIPNLQVQGIVSVAWAQDGRTLFYTQSDDNQRPFRVLYSKLDSDNMDGVLVFTESEPGFCVDITSTKDGKFITVNSNSRTSSEVYIMDSMNPTGGIRKIRERVPAVQYFVEHHHGFFYILTNSRLNDNKEWNGEDYYLARCPVSEIHSTEWQNVIVPSDEFTIHDMDVFDGFLVLYINKKGKSTFCSINLPINVDCEHELDIEDLDPWFFPVPSDSYSVVPGSNPDYSSSVFRVVLSSPVMPDVIVDYDMSARTFSVAHQEEVEGVSLELKHDVMEENYELRGWKDVSSEYRCENVEVVSHDGTEVPMTILYSRKAWRKGRSPGLVHGYGAYGEPLDKTWCTNRLSLLDRGWVVAFADVRGGGGDSSSWHKSGTGMNKQNSIYDFVSCANFLVNEEFVHRDRLGGIGHSAGSLLLGAAMNMHPNLFRAAILKVPFLDVCNTLLDENLPLSVLDREEFGDPRIRSQFECIRSYSPYDNISPGSCYPSMLVTASMNDTRVGVWEGAKWVAKVREFGCGVCSSSVILKTEMNGGHFGSGGRVGQCEEAAYDYAFLFKAMGVLTESQP